MRCVTASNPWLAPNPAKAAVERWWWLYTPVWGAASAAVMVSGWAESWGDVACMIFGVVLALGALLPLLRPHESEAELPWLQRSSSKLALSVVMLALGLNYVQTPFFFDVLHMHYGFDVRWTLDRNPLFLYLVTIAYFSTYAVLCMAAMRWARRKGMTLTAWALVPLAVAFLETLLNANPFMQSLFCYDDMLLMLWFGTLIYAIPFALTLPVWMAIDEKAPQKGWSWAKVAAAMVAVVLIDGLLLLLIRQSIAPLVTTVVDNAPGLRDYAGSCLVPP